MKRNGFTLIELLVVVAIIGILAAVGVVAYSGYTSGAKKKTTIANHKLIVKYIQNEWAKCEIGETSVMPLNGTNQYNCSSNIADPHLVKAARKVLNTTITDVYGDTDIYLGTFYKCYDTGSSKMENQGQHAIAQGWNGSVGKYFAYVYTCVENSGTPLITNIQLN